MDWVILWWIITTFWSSDSTLTALYVRFSSITSDGIALSLLFLPSLLSTHVPTVPCTSLLSIVTHSTYPWSFLHFFRSTEIFDSITISNCSLCYW